MRRLGCWMLMMALLAPPGARAAEAVAADLSLNQRKLVTLRATLKGESPAERAEAARHALASALA